MADYVGIKNITKGTIFASTSKIGKGESGLVTQADADALIALGQAELVTQSKAEAKPKPKSKPKPKLKKTSGPDSLGV